MSKTFKSASSERKVRIWEANLGVAVCVEDPITNETTSTQIAPSDAPALCLAILEAAGYDDMADDANLADVHAFNAMHKLQESVDTQERATAEAREQSELEAEALELANSAVLVVGNPPYPSIGHMSDTSLRKWLAVARKAREMAKELTNGR